MRKLFALLLVMALLVVAAVPSMAQDRPNIPGVLSSGENGSFTTLLLAAQLTGLDSVLASEGPFTVLAPTDAAFAAALEALGLSAEQALAQPELVASILRYHVIPGRYFFRQLTAGPTLETALAGETVTFNLSGGAFTVNGVRISNPDNIASNGIVHVIDAVLLPASLGLGAEEEAPAEEAPAAVETPAPVVVTNPLIPEILSGGSLGSFGTLLAAAQAAGLVETLSSDGPFTIFAPTDAAFAALLEANDLTAEAVLAQPELLRDILLYHVVPGRFFFRNLSRGPVLDTALEGETIQVALAGRNLTVNGITVTDIDNAAGNGVVFVINGVLLTPAQAAALAPQGATLRVAHLSVDAGAVDVYINGRLALSNVRYPTISEFTNVRPGVFDFLVVPAGTNPPDRAVKAAIRQGDAVTFAVTGTRARNSIRFNVLREDYTPLQQNRVRVSIFHAIENAGPVDVLVNGQLLVGALRYPGTSASGDNDGFDVRDVGAGTYNIQVRSSLNNTVLLDLPNTTLRAGENVFIAAIGTPGNPSVAAAAVTVGN